MSLAVAQKLPAIPTWKLKHSKKKLQEEAKDPATFNRGYRMMSVSPGELKFPSFSKCIQHGLTAGELVARHLPTYLGVDLSSPKRPGNAISAVGLDANNRRALQEIRFGNWKSPETARQIDEMVARYNVMWVVVENNAYQGALIDWTKESGYSWWLKIEAFTTGNNKADPDVGLPALEVEFHNQGWIIPGGEFEGHPPQCACDWCRFKAEFSNYPKGKSSDGIMSTWFARDAISRWAPRRSSRGGRQQQNPNKR